jgi:septum formation protein
MLASYNNRILLASTSVRRAELLSLANIQYDIFPVQIDETCDCLPEDRVMRIAEQKALSAAEHVHNRLILAADTLVWVNNCAFGKPADSAQACYMLKTLSGKCHRVFTGVCLLNAADGYKDIRYDCTNVIFTNISDEEINVYVASGETMDKAGAYAIQCMGGMYIERIEGSYSNVVGLPMALLRHMLIDSNHANLYIR